jgi:NADPH-dependent glutamate synthase beta subunit-like oxidoreductase
VLDAEIRRIVDLGIELEYGTRSATCAEMTARAASMRRFLPWAHTLPSVRTFRLVHSARMLDAVSVLRSMEAEDKPMLGRRVVVYGGGNTALDVARTARRLGATEAIIVYRRTREKMPAHDFEVEEALQEGVFIKWLSTIKHGRTKASLTVEKMELDADGVPQPTGEFETLEADSAGAGAGPGCGSVAAR